MQLQMLVNRQPFYLKVLIALIILVCSLWLITRTVEHQKYIDSNYPRSADLTIVTELSTYNVSRKDLKTVVAEIAIESWLLNTPNVLVLVEKDETCSGLTSKFPLLRCVRHYCNHQDFNIPTVPCLMMRGESLSTTKYIMFTNGDIAFGPIQPTLAKVANAVDTNFVIAGQRIDVHTRRVLESDISSSKQLLSLARSEGELHGESAIDYFIYFRTASFARKMPPFLIGNWKWDNWFLHEYIVSEQMTVIDATTDIAAVHVGATSTALAQRRGAVYNSRVFESSTFGIQGIGMGTLRFADAIAYQGQVLDNHDMTVAWTKFIFSLTKTSETLVVVTVPCGFLPILQNWLQWAQRAGLRSYIIFAMDWETMNFAKQRKLPIPPLHHRLLREDTQCNQMRGRKTQELLVHRNYLLQNISQAGLGFVSVSVNSVLLEPFPFTSLRNKEIFGQRLDENMSTTFVSDGMWGVPAAYSRLGLKLLRGVVACQELQLNRSSDWKLATVDCGRDLATQCLNSELDRNFPESVSLLPETVVAGAQAMFIQHRLQRRGQYPTLVHQDMVCGLEESVALWRRWNLLLGQEKIEQMLPHAPLSPVMPQPSDYASMSLLIRVLSMGVGNAENLRQLLDSLQKADYGEDSIDIEIHIDCPLPNAPNAELHNYQSLKQVAQKFQWQRGKVTIVDPGTHRGHFDMFVQPFRPRFEGQLMLLLEDSNELSPMFYQWLRAAFHHFRPADDAKLYGIALQRQHSVIGLRPEQRYSRSFIDLRVDPSRAFFRYQLLSSWGTTMFPHHWNSFVQWARDVRKKSPEFQPCVPYFYSNNWVLKKQPHFWTVWFNYYAYINGLYSLYVNYARFDSDDGKRFALFRSQHRHLSNSLNMLQEPAPKMFLPTASYPLYDFHLNLVANSLYLNDRWRLMSGVEDKCQNNHVHIDKRFGLSGDWKKSQKGVSPITKEEA